MRKLVLLLLLAAPLAHPQAMCPAADRKQLQSTFEQWVKAYKAHDLAGTMAIFADDLVFSFQNAPDQTRAQMEKAYRAEFAKPGGSSEWVPMFEEFECSGDLAFVRSTWELREARPDGSTAVDARNRSVDILRRSPAGKWRIFRSLNYPVVSKAE
jgi:uncharacterized protein (TIGR02246 family)